VSVGILDARVKLGAVIAPQSDDEPPVHLSNVDAVAPPCIIIGWNIPMVDDWRACAAMGHLTLQLVGARIEAVGGVEAIESMYDTVQRRLREDAVGWTVRTDEGITALLIGGVQYLGCRVNVRVPIAV
jgi:hypothetical protein